MSPSVLQSPSMLTLHRECDLMHCNRNGQGLQPTAIAKMLSLSVGGVAGLVAAWQVGPRLGRFDGAIVKPIPGHNVESTVLGTLMLWFGWYGFNVGELRRFMVSVQASQT